MSVASPIRWLFTPPNPPGVGRSIIWWEKRRIPVNALIFVYGIVCLVIFFAAINASHVLQPGEDAVEPIGIILAPIAFNICYTFGWLVEAPARAVAPGLTAKLGPRLLLAGLIFSFCLISLPAVFWAGVLHPACIGSHEVTAGGITPHRNGPAAAKQITYLRDGSGTSED